MGAGKMDDNLSYLRRSSRVVVAVAVGGLAASRAAVEINSTVMADGPVVVGALVIRLQVAKIPSAGHNPGSER